jgi:hypothetical protein
MNEARRLATLERMRVRRASVIHLPGGRVLCRWDRNNWALLRSAEWLTSEVDEDAEDSRGAALAYYPTLRDALRLLSRRLLDEELAELGPLPIVARIETAEARLLEGLEAAAKSSGAHEHDTHKGLRLAHAAVCS